MTAVEPDDPRPGSPAAAARGCACPVLRLREVWTPGEAFLARLSMAQLDALYRDLTGGTHGISDRLIKPRKDDAVDLVAELFAHPAKTEARIRAANWPMPGDLAARIGDWLPAPLRPAGGRSDV